MVRGNSFDPSIERIVDHVKTRGYVALSFEQGNKFSCIFFAIMPPDLTRVIVWGHSFKVSTPKLINRSTEEFRFQVPLCKKVFSSLHCNPQVSDWGIDFNFKFIKNQAVHLYNRRRSNDLHLPLP